MASERHSNTVSDPEVEHQDCFLSERHFVEACRSLVRCGQSKISGVLQFGLRGEVRLSFLYSSLLGNLLPEHGSIVNVLQPGYALLFQSRQPQEMCMLFFQIPRNRSLSDILIHSAYAKAINGDIACSSGTTRQPRVTIHGHFAFARVSSQFRGLHRSISGIISIPHHLESPSCPKLSFCSHNFSSTA